MGTESSGQSKPFKLPLLERLVHYYHFIGQMVAEDKVDTVSSAQIARYVNMDDTQVRKDLAAIGVRGAPRIGFRTAQVVDRIRAVLGFDGTYNAIIVGAGRLGGAIALYPGFSQYGLCIIALFDSDPRKIGRRIGDLPIQDIAVAADAIRERNVRLAILTVPPEAAQGLAEKLADAGVRAIWNFAPTNLNVPSGVVVRHEHISVGLGELLYYLKRGAE